MTEGHVNADRDAHRRERMAMELLQEGIPILGGAAYTEQLRAQSEKTDALIVEELVHARHSPVHEGIRPSYGSLIVPELGGLPKNFAEQSHQLDRDSAPDPLRSFVDGSTTVVVRDLAGNCGVVRVELGDELAVVDVLRATNGVSVQRLVDGRLRVGTQTGIALNDGGDWTLRPSAGTVVTQLHKQLHMVGDDRQQRMANLRALVEFCLHALSPNGIGATLVVALVDDAAPSTGTSDPGSEPTLALNVFDRGDQRLFYNLLAANDGACVISVAGDLVRYKAKLKASEQAIEVMKEMGGDPPHVSQAVQLRPPRHASYRRFG